MLGVEEILRNLVECNTIADKENRKILDYIENVLSFNGFQTEKRDKFLIMYNKKESAIGFVGHTDTVEYTENWKYRKLALTKENGKLYGLGVCDMKGGIAAMLQAVIETDWSKLKRGMKLYFTYDEEIGFSGIKEIVEYETNFPKTMIIGEPTNNERMVGSKGLLEYQISCKGVKTHSSTPEKGKNAILSAISFIRELQEFYELELKTKQNLDFEIPYTTMNIGKIEGGSAINSVPDFCEFLVDFRTIDREIEEKIVRKIESLKEKYCANVQELNRLSAFLNKTDFSDKTCNFITEASFLKNNRIILGPGPITAHEMDEYISEDSLCKLVEQYKELIEEKCQ